MTFIFINVSVAKPWRPPILIAPFSVAATLQPPSTNEHQKITRKRKKKMREFQRRQFIEMWKDGASSNVSRQPQQTWKEEFVFFFFFFFFFVS